MSDQVAERLTQLYDKAVDERDQLRAQRDRLREALQQVAAIASRGVIERRETGKPIWSMCAALTEIANAALADCSEAKGVSV